MPPLSSSRTEFAGKGIGGRFRRLLWHVRSPRSLPALIWRNVNYEIWKIRFAVVSRRPGYSNELGRDLAAHKRYEEALLCYDHALAIKGDIPQIWANRSRSSLRQFRQPTPGDWPSVISRAHDALQRLVEGDNSQLRP